MFREELEAMVEDDPQWQVVLDAYDAGNLAILTRPDVEAARYRRAMHQAAAVMAEAVDERDVHELRRAADTAAAVLVRVMGDPVVDRG